MARPRAEATGEGVHRDVPGVTLRRRVGLADWWIAVPIVSVGVLTFTSLLYVGLRARKRAWLRWSAFYLGAFLFAFGLDAIFHSDSSGTFAGFMLFFLAGGGLAHCLAIRGSFYSAIADAQQIEYDAAERRLAARELGRKTVAEDPSRARQLGIGRPDLKDAFDAALVDLNSAPAPVIASVCGVSAATAQRIVDAREKTGEFSSVEDLDLLVDLPTDQVARLKDAGVCVPRD